MAITLIRKNDTKSNTKEILSLEETKWEILLNTASAFEWDAPGTGEPDDWTARANGETWGGKRR